METPAVTTNVGDLLEIPHQGCHGFIVAERNAEAFALAIEMIAKNPAQAIQMSTSGRKIVETHFNSGVSALELKRLLTTKW